MLEYSRNAHREKCWSSVNSIRPWAFGPVVISIRPLAFGPVVNSIPPLAFGSVMNSIRPLAFGPVVPTCSTLPYLSLTFSQSNLTVLKRKSFWKSLISNTHTQHTITHAHTQSHTHTNSKKCCKWENSICSSFLGGSVIERCRCFKVLAYHVGSRPHFGSLLEFFFWCSRQPVEKKDGKRRVVEVIYGPS